MERLLTKIRELEKEALSIASRQERIGRCIKEDSEYCTLCESEDWIKDVRRKGGEWTAKPLVVLSLFDGIGGIWVALERLGIPFIGYSCEVSDAAMQVVKHRYGMIQHLGDVKKLEKHDIPEKVDLIVGGFPCQDLSSLGHKMGLHGQRSRLFFEMLRVIKIFNPTWYLAENVASMTWIDRQEISKHLNTTPIEIDAEEITPSKRRRIYWSNLPYPKRIPRIRDHESTSLQSVLHNAIALDKKVGCILSQNNQKAGYGSLELVMDNSTNKLRYISVLETELAMGYPPGYTNVKYNHTSDNKTISSTANFRSEVNVVTNITRCAGDKVLRSKKIVQASQSSVPETKSVKASHVADGINRSIRWQLLGNTFSVPVISYLLSPLLNEDVRSAPPPICLPKCIREQECSAMDSGEVWALFNSHERPNWYAVVVSRSGDRFSDVKIQQGKKRPPIYIEVKFMEMTSAYAVGEPDWDTNRGTGLFHLRELIDKQNSWVTFSHRVSSYLKFEKHYFIYPGKDEVWAIYDSAGMSRFLVYVMTSFIDKHKAKQGKPGKEGFFARCRLLQRTELEVYRFMDTELEFTDLSVFAFRAPFHYKNECNLLRIELTTRQRKQVTDSEKHYNKRRKRNSDSESDEPEEVEATDSEAAVVLGENDTGEQEGDAVRTSSGIS